MATKSKKSSAKKEKDQLDEKDDEKNETMNINGRKEMNLLDISKLLLSKNHKRKKFDLLEMP